MRIFLGLIMWTIPLAIMGLSGCDLKDEFEEKFAREAMLVKTCRVDEGISKVPLRVYRYYGKLWFKENSKWWQIDAEVDKVCDVLDVDAQNGIRRLREDHNEPRTADLFTWRTRLVRGSFYHRQLPNGRANIWPSRMPTQGLNGRSAGFGTQTSCDDLQ